MELKELLGTNYRDGMTVEDIAAAIKDLNLVDPTTLEPSVSKAAFDRAASELAAMKKQARDRMTADELAKQQQEEAAKQVASLQAEVARMKQEKAFINAGYDAETAEKLSQMIVDGDTDGFVKAQIAWADKLKTDIYASTKEELLKSTPGLVGAGSKVEVQKDVDLAKEIAASRPDGANRAALLEKFKK